MRRIQILAGVRPEQRRLAAKVAKLLGSEFELAGNDPELIIVVGGDGTLLHYLKELNFPTAPILGVDAGSLGFFQEVSASELNDLPQILRSRQYSLQALPLLSLQADGQEPIYAFNEFAVERASARAAHLSLNLDGHRFERFIGDGLIISTPQGSTAYASAAGGAVLPYDLHAFEVVPNNPHGSALYKALRQPLVLGQKATLGIEVLDPEARPVRLVADGHQVPTGNAMTIQLSGHAVTMLRTQKFNFYERLSQKLIG
jgi:NAD+ kinase